MKRLASILILTGLIFLVGCGTDYYADQMVMPSTSSGKTHQNMAGSGESLKAKGKISDFRRAEFADGSQMDYWLINASPEVTVETDGAAMATIILLHDLGDSKSSMLKLGQRLSELGYDVVLPDLRTHGRSSGNFFTYGAREQEDLRTLMDQLLREQVVSPKIIAFGDGVGGSIAIIYAASDPNCMGVVANQPYSDLRGTLEGDSAFNMLKEDGVDDVIDAGCAKGDFRPGDASAALSAMQLRCPIRVIRRDSDVGYDSDQAQRIYDCTSGHKEMEVVEYGSEDWSYKTGTTEFFATEINEFALGGLVTGYYRDVMKQRQAAGTAP